MALELLKELGAALQDSTTKKGGLAILLGLALKNRLDNDEDED